MTVRRVSRDYDISPSPAPPSVLFQRFVGTTREDGTRISTRAYLSSRFVRVPIIRAIGTLHACASLRDFAVFLLIFPPFHPARHSRIRLGKISYLERRREHRPRSVTSVSGVEIWVIPYNYTYSNRPDPDSIRSRKAISDGGPRWSESRDSRYVFNRRIDCIRPAAT